MPAIRIFFVRYSHVSNGINVGLPLTESVEFVVVKHCPYVLTKLGLSHEELFNTCTVIQQFAKVSWKYTLDRGFGFYVPLLAPLLILQVHSHHPCIKTNTTFIFDVILVVVKGRNRYSIHRGWNWKHIATIITGYMYLSGFLPFDISKK